MLRIALAVSLAVLLAPAPAGAHVLHTVSAGESLWSIAAQNNLTTRTVAAYNGLSSDARVRLGSTLRIPSIAEGAAALAAGGMAPGVPSSAPSAAVATVATASAGAPPPHGGYVVRPGDTLSALAANSSVGVQRLAWVNGLDPAAPLLVGTVLKLPYDAPALARAATQPAPAARVVPAAGPLPSPGRLSAQRVAQLAAEHGVPGSLAAAIAWQESGFNNDLVSTANARGVMQVMPGTWDWVQRTLARAPLSATSAEDNVRAGSLYLASLLRQTGGDARLAAAGYYQGLASVRARGLYDDTRRYVDNVMALRARFGG